MLSCMIPMNLNENGHRKDKGSKDCNGSRHKLKMYHTCDIEYQEPILRSVIMELLIIVDTIALIREVLRCYCLIVWVGRLELPFPKECHPSRFYR